MKSIVDAALEGALSKSVLVAALLALPLLSGCAAAAWGNLIVLGVTVGIFVGTLSLGRSSQPRSDSAASTTANPSAPSNRS